MKRLTQACSVRRRFRRLVTLLPTLSEAVDTPSGAHRSLMTLLHDLPKLLKHVTDRDNAQQVKDMLHVSAAARPLAPMAPELTHARFVSRGRSC